MRFCKDYTVLKTGETVRVEIEIDIDAIAQTVAARAVHNRTGKATLLQGNVKATLCKNVVFFGDEPPDRTPSADDD